MSPPGDHEHNDDDGDYFGNNGDNGGDGDGDNRRQIIKTPGSKQPVQQLREDNSY